MGRDVLPFHKTRRGAYKRSRKAPLCWPDPPGLLCPFDAIDLPLRSINAPRSLPGVDFSDHLNYWNCGFPALMITDTAFYRNKRYHHPEDVISTLDFNRMAKVVEQVHAAVSELER